MHHRALIYITALLLACNRAPLPSAQAESCASMCEAVACVNPELDEDALEDCNAHCHAKFEAASEQGPACAKAFEQGMQCLTDLSCSEYESWVLTEPSAPCPEARGDVAGACDGIYLEAQALPP